MRSDLAGKNAEFSQLVSAMDCSQEQRLLNINVYKFDVSFSSTMT